MTIHVYFLNYAMTGQLHQMASSLDFIKCSYQMSAYSVAIAISQRVLQASGIWPLLAHIVLETMGILTSCGIEECIWTPSTRGLQCIHMTAYTAACSGTQTWNLQTLEQPGTNTTKKANQLLNCCLDHDATAQAVCAATYVHMWRAETALFERIHQFGPYNWLLCKIREDMFLDLIVADWASE